ncbi:MAG: tetratricopeptide repeat protein [Desulfobulbaceae bacterium]|nr:tetratricopeptide repeat protein [Desulfobulbaceae bacterium]
MEKRRVIFHSGVIAVLVVTVLAAYANVLDGQFVFDDSRIYNNPNLRITSLDWASLRQVVLKSEPVTRPVANLSFALNYYLHGDALPGFHLFNVLVHLLTGVLLYGLVLDTLPLLPGLQSYRPAEPGGNTPYPWLAFLAVWLWLLHPLQTQAVSYVVQRMSSLAAMFYLLSLWLYVRGRLRHDRASMLFYAGSVVAGLFALGSKESSVTLPFFILLYEWYFLQNLRPDWLRRHLPAVALAAGVAILLGFFYLGGDPVARILAGYDGRDFSLAQRLLTEARVLFFYLGLILFPAPGRLNLDHDFIVSTSLLQPVTTLLAVAALAGMVWLACRSARQHRLFSFALIWFLGNLLVESSVIALELVFEHRLYLPSMLLFAAAVTEIGRRLPPRWLRAGVATAVALAMLLGFWTFERNKVWHDRISLWSDCAQKSPAKARPKNNLGVALKRAGRLPEAAEQFWAVIAIDPTFTEAYNNLANIMVDVGRGDEALRLYGKALELSPGNPAIHDNIGRLLLERRNYGRAMMHFAEVVRLQPDFPEAQANLLFAQRMWRQGASPLTAQDH